MNMTKQQEQEFDEFQARVKSRTTDMAARKAKWEEDSAKDDAAKEPRKVIQVMCGVHGGSNALLALCDDGTMWFLQNNTQWEVIRPVPQD